VTQVSSSARTENVPDWAARVVTEVERLRDSYRLRAKQHRRWFRSFGVLVIVLSTSLPALTISKYGAQHTLLAVIGVTIALLTGLRNFYQWDRLWGLLRQSDFELTYLLDKWELDIGAITAQSEPERLQRIHELTSKLRDASEEIRRSESTRYFGSLNFPQSSSS